MSAPMNCCIRSTKNKEKTGCIAREEAVRAACGQIGAAAHALLAVPGAEEAARQILAAVDKIKE